MLKTAFIFSFLVATAISLLCSRSNFTRAAAVLRFECDALLGCRCVVQIALKRASLSRYANCVSEQRRCNRKQNAPLLLARGRNKGASETNEIKLIFV